MSDTDKEEYDPMISDTKPETMKPLKEERMTNKAVLDNIVKFLSLFSLFLFISLTVACITSWRLDPIAVVIGYWLVLFVFGAGYMIKKNINDSHLSITNYCVIEFKRLIFSRICNMTNLIAVISKKVVSELIHNQDWSISYLAMCLIALGSMITFGTTLMHVYFKLNDPLYLAIKVSFGIWVIIQGTLIVFPSRKLLPWTIMSNIVCLSISVYLTYGLYDYPGKYLNSLTYLERMIGIVGLGCTYDYDTRQYNCNSYPFGLGRNIEKVASNWPKDDHGKPIYPNWILILSLVMQKGSMIPLVTFLILVIICNILNAASFERRDSALENIARKKQQKMGVKYKPIFALCGSIFIALGLFMAYFRVFLENITPLFYDTYWLTNTYGIIANLMCSIFIIIGFLTLYLASKSRSTLSLVILFLSILTLWGVCIYSSVVSVRLQDPNFPTYYGPRFATFTGGSRTSLDTTWDTMMKNAFHCNKSPGKNMTSDGEMFLCEDYVHSRCAKFPLNQDNFCNGVLDFPPYESRRYRKTFTSLYYLSDCNNGYYSLKFYKTWIFFVDEFNCNPFNQTMEISLKITFVMSTSLGILSIVVFFGLLKQKINIQTNLNNLI